MISGNYDGFVDDVGCLGNVAFCVLFFVAGATGKGGVISVNYDDFIDYFSVCGLLMLLCIVLFMLQVQQAREV